MIYLDNSATTYPKPDNVIEAFTHAFSDFGGNPGRSGHSLSIRTSNAIYDARATVASFFNILEPDHIIFTKNATEALNIGLFGSLNKGDHVITTSMEHNSVLRPLQHLKNNGIQITIADCEPDGSLDIARIMNALRPNTKMLVCTHASNVTGTIMPVQELSTLAKEYNLLFFVDASQSAGVLPLDVSRLKVDLLAAPGHKGLLGPMGTGLLYISPSVEFHPVIFGGTGTYSKELEPPWELPESLEPGTVNVPGICGLAAGISFIQSIGRENILNWEHELNQILDSELRNMPGIRVYGPSDCCRRVGVTAFNILSLSCEAVAEKLSSEYDIAVRAGFHCAGLAHKTIGTWETGAVRLSAGPFTTISDIHAAIDAIYKISQGL